MNIYKNSRTTPYSQAEIVRRVMVLRETPRAVAAALGVSRRTVAKWLARFRAEGEAGLAYRSSHPHAIPRATPADVVEQVIALPRQRLCGKQIAKGLALAPVTISRVLYHEKKESAVALLHAAIEYYCSLDVTVTRVMINNVSCYKTHAFREACKALGLKHIRT